MVDQAQNVDNLRTPRARQKQLLQTCLQRAEHYVETSLKQVMDKLYDVLLSRSNKDGTDAGTFMAAADELKLKRQDLIHPSIEKFRQTYNSRLTLDQPANIISKAGVARTSGLSLIKEQDLEENLAVDGLVVKVNDRFKYELFVLAKRFNQLVDAAQYREETQPLAPVVFAQSIHDVLKGLDWKVELNLIAYKLFEQNALQSMGDFYNQINSLLCDAQILPELKLKAAIQFPISAAQHRSQRSGQGGAASNARSNIQDGGMQGDATSVDVYQMLQQLMNLKKYGSVPAIGMVGNTPGNSGGANSSGGPSSNGTAMRPSLPMDDLVRVLSLLQHDSVSAESGIATNVAVIKGSLLDQMRQIGDGRDIHPDHDNTIDVIGMIFEFILDEPSIPDVVKNLLNRMQIPILKVAIVDKAFFTNKTHPARRLLNVLGHASIGWNENSEEIRQRRFEKMSYVVNRVLEEFEQDPGIFAALLEEFADYLTKEDFREDRGESIERQTQIESQDKIVFETIEARLEYAEVPEVLREFLRNTWRNVLQHTLDLNGYDSDSWRHFEQTVDDLMWSVEPKTTPDERRKMVLSLPRLLSALREGMVLVQCTKEEIDGIIEALEPVHIASLRAEKPFTELNKHKEPLKTMDAAMVTSNDVSDMIRSIQAGMVHGDEGIHEPGADVDDGKIKDDYSLEFENSDPQVTANQEDEFTAMAADMKLGTWLEFTVDDKSHRGKLAWKSMVMGEYVFVDRKYKVVEEKTLSELAADLRSGQAKVVEKVAMFDRALDKVLNGLMSSSAVH